MQEYGCHESGSYIAICTKTHEIQSLRRSGKNLGKEVETDLFRQYNKQRKATHKTQKTKLENQKHKEDMK